MAQYSRAGPLKRGILLFWALWITIVVLMNVADALKALGRLSGDWKLASSNYEAIVRITARYGTPHWIDSLLFIGVMLWEALAMALFWTAFRHYRMGDSIRWRTVYLAFSSLLALFGAFILSDEVFQAFKMEGDHRGISILLLASLLALQLLPDRIRES
jgi:hypothetical protein